MMEDFFTWAQARRMEASPRMALDNALKYAVGYWPYAMNALGDGRLELDNNLAERAIKPFVIGRKNFLFSDTPRGAEASAGIYSVVATAKANGLNPRKYLEWLLEEIAQRGRPRRPGLPRLADALVGFRAGGDQVEAGSRRRRPPRWPTTPSSTSTRRPSLRRGIGNLSEYSQNEMGKLREVSQSTR